MFRRIYASHTLQSLQNADAVAEALNEKDEDKRYKNVGLISGALGAISKGGRTVPNDEETKGRADHYINVLHGKTKQKLGEKDFKKIANLIEIFLNPSSK